MKPDQGPKNGCNFGFVRVAAVSPEVVIGNVFSTAVTIVELAKVYAQNGVKLIAFPELCLAGGYTNADLFHQTTLQNEVLRSLEFITACSDGIDATLIIGLPLCVNSTLFNVAAVINRGKIVGIVPKTYLPNGGEFYEARWFGSAPDLTVSEIELFGKIVPIGTDLLFPSKEDSNVIVGVEICEDIWTPIPPSSFLAVAGATVIVNLSASNELVGKAAYRRQLIAQQSGRCIAAYIYSCAGPGESTTDVVFGGHNIIAENGSILEESNRFEMKSTGITADLDLDLCVLNRMKTTSFAKCAHELRGRTFRRLKVSLPKCLPNKLQRPNPSMPFVPTIEADKAGVCADVFNIQTSGLIRRLKSIGCHDVVLGLSGGLDSTLALLVCLKAFERLSYSKSGIHVYTMPGFGTTEGTKSNAIALAEACGIEIETIPIAVGSNQILQDIGHDTITQDVVFENAQARYRTTILMQKANQVGGIVIGTGDLSESALGWCTYNGDHMSHYNVNCGVPKTLVRFVVEWVANNEVQPAVARVLQSIVDTPISPELTMPQQGIIAQRTEEIVGPYELHDFFLFHMVRRGSSPGKIMYLAEQAHGGAGGKYGSAEIEKWLRMFITRFFKSQFKRSAVPDGPKVGSVALSPRGDWRMPSDASPEQWLQDLDRYVAK